MKSTRTSRIRSPVNGSQTLLLSNSSSGNRDNTALQLYPASSLSPAKYSSLPPLPLKIKPIIQQTPQYSLSMSLQHAFPNAEWDLGTQPPTLLNPDEIYIMTGKLGQGAFGQVRKIRVNATGKDYALKLLKTANVSQLIKETDALKIISHHPNCRQDIVCLYGAFRVKGANGLYTYAILYDYIPGVNLLEYIENNSLSYKQLARIAQWLTETMRTLHNLGFVHRDIKPQNIVVTPYEPPTDTDIGKLTLIDFGLSCLLPRRAPPGETSCSLTIVGTPYYIAPELKQKPVPADTDLAKSDVFSLGVTLYELASKDPEPYGHDAAFPDEIPQENDYKPLQFGPRCYKDLVADLLTINPEDRPDINEAAQLADKCYRSLI